MNPRIQTILAIFLFVLPITASSAPDAVRLKADTALLVELERSYIRLGYGDKFNLVSQRLADQRGPEIIHAVMRRSRKWKQDVRFIFVPLLTFLPRKPTLDLLRQYQRSKRASERLWANGYVTEFNKPDGKQSEKKFFGKK